MKRDVKTSVVKTAGVSGATAIMLLGRDIARVETYVVGKVREHLQKEMRMDRAWWERWEVPRVVIREGEETLEQCIERHGLPSDLFSGPYGQDSLVYRALDRKSRGQPYRTVGKGIIKPKSGGLFALTETEDRNMDESPSKAWKVLNDAGIILVRADQPGNEPPAIIYVSKRFYSFLNKPSIALVSVDALWHALRIKARNFAESGLKRLRRMYQAVDAPTKKRRIIEIVERGRVGEMVKAHREYKCQVCEALGRSPLMFDKKQGGYYAEAHHVDPVSVGGSLGPENIIVVCAHHHRQIHHGKTELVRKTQGEFVFRVDEKKINVEQYLPKK